jgi:general secretion pathway protein C
MPLRLNQLQQSLGETGIRRLALTCNVLLLGWIAWMVAQHIIAWQQPDADAAQAGKQQKSPIARIPETPGAEQYNIAGWHLFGVPSTQHEKPAQAKTNVPETRLNLELNGIYRDDLPGNSRAIISEKGKQQEHYRVGEKLPGNAVLDEIHEEYVLLLRNGRYERLALTEDTGNSLKGNRTATNPALRQLGRQLAKPATRPRRAKQSTSTLLRLRPVVREGLFVGMSIRGGNSEGQRLLDNTNVKLEPGDVVIAINGMEIRSAEAGMAMLEDYNEPERLELMIKRDDKTIPVIIDPAAGN